ncbi:MAG: hypothetical protein H5U11_13885 [Rhizobium sp.]|nr:hypothetical protein [Rhizobium sp.]
MTELVAHRIWKLVALTRCPVCGADLVGSDGGVAYAASRFSCGSEFIVTNGEIAASTVCPAGSHVAAAALNKEAADDAAKAGAV